MPRTVDEDTTYLAHTAQYRANFHGAQDGWYLATGGTWRVADC